MPYLSAIKLFSTLKKYKAPFEKIVIIAAISDQITESATTFWSEMEKYIKKDYLLTQTELKFYKILKSVTDELDLIICPQIPLYEIVKNKKKIFGNNNDLIIGTFFNTEPGILNNQLKEDSNVEVKFLGNLIREYLKSNDANLLLPGFVPPRFLAELYKDYSKIFILNYDGFNRKNIEQQIKSIENPDITEETKVMGYFLELYDYLGMNKDNAFVKNYKKRLKEWEKERLQSKAASELSEPLKRVIRKVILIAKK